MDQNRRELDLQAHKILEMGVEDIPSFIEGLRAQKALSKLVCQINSASLSRDPGARQVAQKMLDRLGFI
ncbi:MAG: hypothetical protein PHX82_02840 [Paracoccaceae bacterium]|nr:hypothetical protein [Paracoccaceae bacterium]